MFESGISKPRILEWDQGKQGASLNEAMRYLSVVALVDLKCLSQAVSALISPNKRQQS